MDGFDEDVELSLALQLSLQGEVRAQTFMIKGSQFA
jgi:hypothetical protein